VYYLLAPNLGQWDFSNGMLYLVTQVSKDFSLQMLPPFAINVPLAFIVIFIYPLTILGLCLLYFNKIIRYQFE